MSKWEFELRDITLIRGQITKCSNFASDMRKICQRTGALATHMRAPCSNLILYGLSNLYPGATSGYGKIFASSQKFDQIHEN